MTFLYKLQPCTTVLLACFLTLSSGQAVAKNFEPPKLDGFNMHAERDADGDEDGVKETHIKQYFNTSGDSIVSMTTKEQVWAWSLNTRDNDSGNRNYVIRDSNCDGQFDEVYGLDDDFHVPDCLK
jgi:hypothetical protein